MNQFPNMAKAGIYLDKNGRFNIDKFNVISNEVDEVTAQRAKKQMLNDMNEMSYDELQMVEVLLQANG
jgi:hypothetical protein